MLFRMVVVKALYFSEQQKHTKIKYVMEGEQVEDTRKQKANRKQEGVKLKITLSSVLVWIAKLLCIFILGIALLLAAKLVLCQTSTIPMSTEEKVIDIGLAIIGLAIAIWAGLNIVNSIERKELEELRARTDGVKKLINNLDDIESIAYDTFLQALLRMGNDEATKYFYKEFSKHAANRNLDYYTLTRIEDLFGQVYSLHNTVDHFDMVLLEKAEEALEYIEDFETQDRLVALYLIFRKAELNYYSGYVGGSAREKYKYFSTAINLYQYALPKMNIVLPQYRKCKNPSEIPEIPTDADRKLTIYMANTIGDSCRKIIEMKPKLKSEDLPVGDRIPEDKIRHYGDMALFYCGCAAKWADGYDKEVYAKDLHYFEVYYRNCGVAYEQCDRVFGPMHKNAKIIIENYLKAFYHIVKGTKIPLQRVQSVYCTLFSYLKCYFDSKLKFDNFDKLKFDDFEKLKESHERAKALDEAINSVFDISGEELDYLCKMVDISKLAMEDMPRNNLPVVMYGFAYSYVILLKLKDDPLVCNKFKEEYPVYLSKIENVICKLNTMNIDDKYKSALTCRYDALKDHINTKVLAKTPLRP